MALPETDVARVRRWCAGKVPNRLRDEVRVGCATTPRHITIEESHFMPGLGEAGDWVTTFVARLRYTASRQEWTLYWPDRNSRFHRYEFLDPAPSVVPLLTEIDADPTAIFWG